MSEYHKHRDGLTARCRSCRSAEAPMQQVWTKYRLRPEQYAAILAAQGGVCAICAEPGALKVDHDHACCPGEFTCGSCVRGLLCLRCNAGIGQLREDPAILASASAYLATGGIHSAASRLYLQEI